MAKQKAIIQTINAAILARVSTQGQKDNSSLDGQLNAGREYCAQQCYNVVAERKEIMSGAFVLARSVFTELLDMAADGLIQVIVVDVPDRLGRGDARAKLEYMAQLSRARIEYVRRPYDTSTPEGVAQDGIEIVVSGLERIRIKERTSKGIKNRIAEGNIIAPPVRPYGYRVVQEHDHRGRKSCTFEIVESEARVIRDLYEWCVYEGMTLNAMVNRLNARQIPRMSDTDPKANQAHLALTVGRTRYSGWGRTQVRNIIRNKLYQGQWQYGKTKTQRIDAPGKVKRKVMRRAADDEGILTVAVPAVVSLDLWNAAQEQLEENKRKFMHPPINDYILRGRLQCATCQKIMIGHGVKRPNGTITRYYECCNARPGGLKNETHHCKVRYLRADFAEMAVWNSVRDAMQEPDRLWMGVRKSNEANKQARRILEQAIAADQVEIDQIREKEERLLDLYESKDITKEKYFARLAVHQADIDKHDTERKRISERLGEYAVLTPEQEEILQHFQHEIASRMTDDVPTVDRLQLYYVLRVQCIYNSETDEMLITGLFGEATVHDVSTSHGK